MLRVAVTGSTGLIGTALARTLEARGDEVVRLPRSQTYAPGSFANVDLVVNLAGAPVAQRWTAKNRKLVEDSRVARTADLARTIASTGRAVRLISASAVGIYGDRGDQVLTEAAAPGHTWLAELCQAWESAAGPTAATIRTGIVMSREGGALGRQLPLIRAGLGGPLGTGRQYWPWITLADHVRAICFLIDHPDLTGPFNLVSPIPCSQLELTKLLAKRLHRPALVPTPGFALRIALGGFADEILASQRVVPYRLERAGFRFDHPTPASAAAWTIPTPAESPGEQS